MIIIRRLKFKQHGRFQCDWRFVNLCAKHSGDTEFYRNLSIIDGKILWNRRSFIKALGGNRANPRRDEILRIHRDSDSLRNRVNTVDNRAGERHSSDAVTRVFTVYVRYNWYKQDRIAAADVITSLCDENKIRIGLVTVSGKIWIIHSQWIFLDVNAVY